MKPSPRLIALALLGLLLWGCMHSAPAPPPPTVKKFIITQGIKYEDIWVATVRAMTKSLNIMEINQKRGVIKGNLSDWGFREHLTVSIKPDTSDPDAYRLDVVSTRSRSVVMRDWGEDMLQDLKGMIDKTPNRSASVRLVVEPLP
jgi:hypothetical protein